MHACLVTKTTLGNIHVYKERLDPNARFVRGTKAMDLVCSVFFGQLLYKFLKQENPFKLE